MSTFETVPSLLPISSRLALVLIASGCSLSDKDLGSVESEGAGGDGSGGSSAETGEPGADGSDGTPPGESDDSSPEQPACGEPGYQLECKDDADLDGIPLCVDVDPGAYNPDQRDADGDQVADVADLCPTVYSENGTVTDSDRDGLGNDCDACALATKRYNELADELQIPDSLLVRNIPDTRDRDGDGIGDACDNCITVPNCLDFGPDDPWAPGDSSHQVDPQCQRDDDLDGIGDACEGMTDDGAAGPVGFGPQDDLDLDGLANQDDACPRLPLSETTACSGPGECPPNSACVLQEGSDVGVCNHVDTDGDRVGDACDTCSVVENPAQVILGGMQEDDEDEDFVGQVCDTCPEVANPPPMDFYEISVHGMCCTTLLVEGPNGNLRRRGGAELFDPDGRPLRLECSEDEVLEGTCRRLPPEVATRPGVLTLPPGCDRALDGRDPSENRRMTEADTDDPWSFQCRLPQSDQDFDGIGDSCDLCLFAFDPSNTPYVDDEGKLWETAGRYCNGPYSIEAQCSTQ